MTIEKRIPMAGSMEKMAVSSEEETSTFVQVPGGHIVLPADVANECEIVSGEEWTVFVSKKIYDLVGDGIREAMENIEDVAKFRSVGDDDDEEE